MSRHVYKYYTYYTVSKIRLTFDLLYNLDIHDPIAILVGRSVTEKVGNHTMLCFPPHLSNASALPCERGNPRRQCTGALCVQQSPTTAVLSTSFLLNHVRQQTRAEHVDFKIQGVIQQRISLESKRLKKSSIDWLISGNALIQRVNKKAIIR